LWLAITDYLKAKAYFQGKIPPGSVLMLKIQNVPSFFRQLRFLRRLSTH